MTTQTEAKKTKKLHSRAAYVTWEKGVKVKGEILRKRIEPSKNKRFADQKVVQVMLSEPCRYTKKGKDKDGNPKPFKVEVAAGSPVNITLKGDCSAIFDLADGTFIDVTCNGKKPGSDGQEYWDFEVEYSEEDEAN